MGIPIQRTRRRAPLLVLALLSSLVAGVELRDAEPVAAQAAVALDPDTLSPHPVPGGGVLGFTESSADSQSWQVHAFAQIGDRIFVGGSFTQTVARPWAGAATFDQPFLAAFDLDTNDVIETWTPALDDVVWALEVHDDTLYVGGEFTTVNGQARQGLVALDPITGEIVPEFVTEINNIPDTFEPAVRGLEIDGDDLYLVGEFNRVIDDEAAHGTYSVARVSAIDGSWDRDFVPRPTGGSVYSISVDPTRDLVILAGTFTSVNAQPDTVSAAIVGRPTGASPAGYPIELNGDWTRSYVTVVDGPTYWIGGEQHLAQARDADDWSLVGCITTGAVGPQDASRCTNWSGGDFGGGDYQVGALLADDVILLGCHCRGNYFSTFSGDNDGKQLGYHAAGVRLYHSDGSEYDFRPNMPTWGEGPYATMADSNGCLYIGGDYSGIAKGFGRFCPVQDADADGRDDLDEDGDGIIRWRDTVDTLGTLVSRDGAVSQSSDLNGDSVNFGAPNAIDGDRAHVYNAHLLAITDLDDQPWWEVDLGAPTVLAGINIFNRTDDQPERLDGVEVLIGESPFGDVDLATARAAASHVTVLASTDDIAQIELADVVGQYVRLQLPDEEYLQLGEVDVFASADTDGDGIGDHRDTVLASGAIVSGTGIATQSSDADDTRTADRAIDGERSGDDAAAAVAATLPESEAWWEVDLGASHLLNAINVWNRTDCCTADLADFEILIGETPFTTMTLAEARAAAVWSTAVTGEMGQLGQFAVPDIIGRYVRIQLSGDSALNLAEVDVLGVASELPPFGTPGNTELTTNNVDEVTLTWDEVANAKGYLVHRDFQYMAWLPAGSTSWTDDSVVEGDTYRYQIRAQALDNTYSPPSPFLEVTVFDEGEFPAFGTPANVVLATNGVDQVDITWEPVADAKGYLIHRDFQFVEWLPFTEAAWTDTDVTQGETYRYQVRAQADDGSYSGPSPMQDVTVFDEGELPSFGTPANAEVSTNGVDEVTLTWEQVADAKGYLIHRDGQFLKWVSFTEATWTDVSVEQGDTHGYQIRAQRPDNTYSDPTDLLIVTVSDGPGLPPFGTPGNVVVTTNGVDAVSIAWEQVADAKGYLIHRDFQYLGFVSFTDATFVDTSVEFGSTYRYQVRAQAFDNTYSAPSALQEVSVGADDTPPSTPQNVELTVEADGSVTISWDPATDNVGVDSYLVHRNWNYRGFTDGETSFSDDTAVAGERLRYQVRARDGAGNLSAPSELVAVTP
ncbi:MAG: discoidin domain-containing protein [Actinomycetota bacterium]